MAVKLASSDIPELYSWLEKHFPETIWLYQRVKTHMREGIPGLQLYVDRWPDCQAVLARFDTNDDGVFFKEFFKNRFEVFGITVQAVTFLVKGTDLVDWSKPAYFDGIPSSLLTTFLDLQAEHEGLMRKTCTLSVLTATAEHLKPLPVPKGMKIGPISEAYIQEVSSNWWYKGDGVDLYLLSETRRHPSVMLATDSGQHVGHMMGKDYSKMASLFIQPRFRGKGYAKVLLSQLAQIYFDKGEDAYVHIDDWNDESMRLHLSLGFQLVPNLELFRVFWKPENIQGTSSAYFV